MGVHSNSTDAQIHKYTVDLMTLLCRKDKDFNTNLVLASEAGVIAQ